MSDLYAIMKPLKKQTSSLLARLLPTGSQPGGSRRRVARIDELAWDDNELFEEQIRQLWQHLTTSLKESQQHESSDSQGGNHE